MQLSVWTKLYQFKPYSYHFIQTDISKVELTDGLFSKIIILIISPLTQPGKTVQPPSMDAGMPV